MNEIKVYQNEAAIKADEANLIKPFIAMSTSSGKIYYNEIPRLTNTVTCYNITSPIYLVYTEFLNNSPQYEIIQPNLSGPTVIDLDAYTAHGRIAVALPNNDINSYMDVTNEKIYGTALNAFRNGVSGETDLTGVDVSEATDFWVAFLNAKATTYKGLDTLDMRKATSLRYCFQNAAATYLDLNNWNVKNVVTCEGLVYGMTNLSAISIDNWYFSKPIVASYMFAQSGIVSLGPPNYTYQHTSHYTQPYPEQPSFWNSTRLLSCPYMFSGTTNLKYCNFAGFDMTLSDTNGTKGWFMNSAIEEVKVGSAMAFGRSSKFIQSIESMFNGCSHLAYLSFSFQSDSCKNMDNWIAGCSALAEIHISSNFFNSPYLNTYDFSGASNWINHDNIRDGVIAALPQLASGTTKFIKFSDNTKAVINADQTLIDTISAKNWMMQ